MSKQYRLSELAEMLHGEAIGSDVNITGLSAVELSSSNDLTYAESSKYLKQALQTQCAAVMVGEQPDEPVTKPLLVVTEPKQAFISLLNIFSQRPKHITGIHPTATISDNATLGQGVSVGANAVIEDYVTIGNNTVVYAGVYIGVDTKIGNECVIYPNAVIMDGVTLEDRVIIGPGCVLGADGYGYQFTGREHMRIPHIGGVYIESDVELGASVCIDRAKTGNTRVGMGTKVDNQVHIAHNVQVGKLCLIVAQVGIAGSSKLGDGVVLAGKVGITDNITVGDGAVVGACAVVSRNIDGGGRYLGYPAIKHSEEMRIEAARMRLPEMLKKLRELEKAVNEIQSKINE